MHAGKLDRRITFQSATESQDSAGQPVKTWANLASVPTVWAKVEHVAGSEAYQGDQDNARQQLLFTVRYRSDITVKMRISYNSEIYDIRSVKELGRQEGLEIVAEALIP